MQVSPVNDSTNSEELLIGAGREEYRSDIQMRIQLFRSVPIFI